MHGAILYSFSRYVQEHYGPGAWDRLLQGSSFRDHVLVPSASYPDEEFVMLVTRLAGQVGESQTAIQEALGEYLVPALVRLYGAFIEPGWRTLELIENTETTIHKVIRMRDAAARPPALDCRRLADDLVVVRYQSKRRMCAVARGILRGVAAHYRETIDVQEPRCMLRGDEVCELHVRRLGLPAGHTAH